METIKVISAFLAVVLSACAIAQIAPADQRRAEYIEKTSIDAATAYRLALAHFAKAFGDSNKAIRIRDESAHQIIASGNMPCNALGSAMIYGDLFADFSLDFQAKDNRVRIAFDDVIIKMANGQVANGVPITSREDMDKVKAECLEPVKAALVGALSGQAKAANW